MNTKFSPLDLVITEALTRRPGLVTVLLRYRTGCVGCLMARFCTLRSAETMHQLQGTAFLKEVEEILNENPGDAAT